MQIEMKEIEQFRKYFITWIFNIKIKKLYKTDQFYIKQNKKYNIEK